jgi:hypothetical protein
LVNATLARLAISVYLVAGAKLRKEEKKQRRLLVFFLNFVTCNFPFLLVVITFDSFQVVIFFYSRIM